MIKDDVIHIYLGRHLHSKSTYRHSITNYGNGQEKSTSVIYSTKCINKAILCSGSKDVNSISEVLKV
jgi:hypothetical protein